MHVPAKAEAFVHRLRRFISAILLAWTVVVAGSLFLHIREINNDGLESARILARSAYEKDITYRMWNASHGGIYAPVTEKSPPNPYLSGIPERDIVTPSGRRLTLINPAYMTRQVHEIGWAKFGLRGHITSLKPVRAANAADPWETAALRAFENGAPEISSVETMDGKEFLRLMRPMVTEQGCLKCHENQGYRLGDVRGGISVSVPMEPFRSVAAAQVRSFTVIHFLFWFSGLVGIAYATNRLRHSELELRQAEETLLKSEELFRLITTTARDAIILMDEKGMISYWNPAAETMFGYTAGEVTGKDLHQLLARPYYASFEEGFRRFKETGNGRAIGSTLEFAAQRKDGTSLPVEVSSSALSIGGKWHAVGIVRDITERKRALESEGARLQAEALNKAKSEFLAHMSHELRTPMNSILGFASILKEGLTGALSGKQDEYVDYILKSGRHLLSLINDILDIAKIESGRMELEQSSFRLKYLLDSAVALQAETALKHGIHISLEHGPDADIILNADEKKVKQVLFNLLGNALKFTPDGGSVALRARRVSCGADRDKTQPPSRAMKPISCTADPGGDSIEISVSDTGIGIRKEDLPKLFTDFTQLQAGYNREYSGTGLGLALSRKLVEMHGGRIWADSEFGKGSTFTFILPVIQPVISG